MQCEICLDTATVKVVEIAGGKPFGRWLCDEHAPFDPYIGGPTRADWDLFFAWLLPAFECNSKMPPATEIGEHGKAGKWAALSVEWSGGAI